jgi:hypothetical protein
MATAMLCVEWALPRRDTASDPASQFGELDCRPRHGACAHDLNEAEAAYKCGNLYKKRRGLMETKESYCGNAGGDVLELSKGITTR